jgi:hypothetical protein
MHADFTYSFSDNVISIVDLNIGNRFVTNDISYVLQQVEQFHQGPINSYRIMYRDSCGVWDGIRWDGETAFFVSLNETDYRAARTKLCSL